MFCFSAAENKILYGTITNLNIKHFQSNWTVLMF